MSESSSEIRKVANRNASFVLYEGQHIITGPLNSNGTGFIITEFIPLEELNLGVLTPEVDGIYLKATPVGGGVTQFDHHKMNYLSLNSSATVEEYARMGVTYQATGFKGDPEPGASSLFITYFNRSSSSGGQEFHYKIKSQDSVTPV